MYGMDKYGKLFADELTEWLIEIDFIQYRCHMSTPATFNIHDALPILCGFCNVYA